MTEERIRQLKKIADEEDIEAVLKLVGELRKAQREYFRTKTSPALKKAMAIESEIDRLLEFFDINVEES